ncbi:MAG: phosphatidylglycerol lysyltransferase domain-containing protein [Lachnospiraceae bacterium]|nr:phosphatidylglycerol lysyltransferase domain-containing protein [Lachnospiraceae bacterium]
MIDSAFKKPEVEDRQIIKSYFANPERNACERTFANALLWSRDYKVRYGMIEDALVFCSDKEERSRFSIPIGKEENVKKAFDKMIQYFEAEKREIHFFNVLEEEFAMIDRWYPNQYEITYDRDEADYVYEREKLATLSGKKLHSKRNHINKFKNINRDWVYETITDGNLEECFQMALKWRSLNGCDENEEKNAEMCVTLNSLRLHNELGLKGGLLRVGGEIVAITMGEPVNAEMFCVHIEKAFTAVDGAYPMINQQFVLNECMDYRYINREEDLGSEGLRKAKLSYRPVFLVEKGILRKKDA